MLIDVEIKIQFDIYIYIHWRQQGHAAIKQLFQF